MSHFLQALNYVYTVHKHVAENCDWQFCWFRRMMIPPAYPVAACCSSSHMRHCIDHGCAVELQTSVLICDPDSDVLAVTLASPGLFESAVNTPRLA